ncbi:nucleotidyltransferase [Microcystis sp. 0824]|nr:nucleotidyltransferase [Microcystis sp. 0824]
MISDAIIRRLQTLAESTQRLSEELKANIPDVDWRNISGFRNILVHDYLGGIDLNK